MILDSKGIHIGKFFLPPFSLKSGEIVVCYLYSGAHFYDLQMQLADLFTEKVLNDNIKIIDSLSFVQHVKYRTLKRPFYPRTVKGFIRKFSNPDNDIASRIYNHYDINRSTRLDSIEGTKRKLMSLYTSLSFTNNIVLDFVGVCPAGSEDIYQVLEENAASGGSAIILDNAPDFKNKCTRFIQLEILEK